MKSFFTVAAAIAFVVTAAAIPQVESSSALSLTLLSSMPTSAQAPTGTVTEEQPTCVTVTVSAPTLRGTTASASSSNVLTNSVSTASASEQTSSLSSDTSNNSTLVGRQNPPTTVTASSSVTPIAIASSSDVPVTISAATGSPSACTVTVVLNASGSVASGTASSTAIPNATTRLITTTRPLPSSPDSSETSSLFNSALSVDVHVHSIFMMLLASLVIAML